VNIPTLREYVAVRTRGSGVAALATMAVDSLGARNHAEFWRVWNPCVGWFLRYYVHRPLRRWVPGAVATAITFVVSGVVIHEPLVWFVTFGWLKPPFATLWFAGIAAAAVATGRADWSRWPWLARAAANAACLAVPALLAGLATGAFRVGG
jgi:hypothetical protein